MKAARYGRQSTQQQADGTSMDTQLAACDSLAESAGHEIPPEMGCREIWSGADIERPVLSSLRHLARAGAFDVLYVYSPDWLSRDPLHLLTLINEFGESGVEVHFVQGISDNTPEGQLMTYVQGYAAQKERMQFVERSMRAKEKIAREGRLPIGTGSGMYGYDYDPVKKVRTVNAEESAVVREIFTMAGQGFSVYRISVVLNERGVRTKRRAQWRYCSVKTVLDNPAYLGMTRYGQYRHRKVKGGKIVRTRRPDNEVVWIEGFTPAILSPEQVKRAHAGIKVYQAKYAARAERHYMLTGFTTCAACGARVVGAGGQYPHRYYRCIAANKISASPQRCQERVIPAAALEEVVWRRVADAIRNPAVLVVELQHLFEDGGGDTAEVMADLKREIQELKDQQYRLIELRQRDMVDQEILEAQLAPLKVLYDEKVQSLGVLEAQLEQRGDIVEMERRIVELCNSVSNSLDDMDFDERRATLAAFGVKVVATRDELLVQLVVSPEFTADYDSCP